MLGVQGNCDLMKEDFRTILHGSTYWSAKGSSAPLKRDLLTCYKSYSEGSHRGNGHAWVDFGEVVERYGQEGEAGKNLLW